MCHCNVNNILHVTLHWLRVIKVIWSPGWLINCTSCKQNLHETQEQAIIKHYNIIFRRSKHYYTASACMLTRQIFLLIPLTDTVACIIIFLEPSTSLFSNSHVQEMTSIVLPLTLSTLKRHVEIISCFRTFLMHLFSVLKTHVYLRNRQFSS